MCLNDCFSFDTFNKLCSIRVLLTRWLLCTCPCMYISAVWIWHQPLLFLFFVFQKSSNELQNVAHGTLTVHYFVCILAYYTNDMLRYYIISVYINIKTSMTRHNWIRIVIFIRFFHSRCWRSQSPRGFDPNKHCINFLGHILLTAVWQARLGLNASDTRHFLFRVW